VKETLTPYHVRNQSISGDSLDGKSQHSFPIDYGNRYDHLLCFLPAMLSLGASTRYPSGSKTVHDDMDQLLARQLLDGCATIYESSKTKISPDKGYLKPGIFSTEDPSYYLRPEYAESLFIIYRFTKDEKLQEMAWDLFQSLENFCKIPSGGYAVLTDVNDLTKGHKDDMPSYFLAETLKYLLLIFGPDKYVSLEDFVFTTEGHPLRKLKTTEDDKKDSRPFCVLRCRPPTPVPWTVLFVGASVMLGIYVMMRNLGQKIILYFVDDKTKTL